MIDKEKLITELNKSKVDGCKCKEYIAILIEMIKACKFDMR